MRRHLVTLAFVAASLVAPSANAQEGRGFALGRFSPAERGSDWFSLDSLDFRGRLRPAFGLVGDWAHDPLVIRNADGSQRVAVVADQALVHAGGSLVVADRFRFALSLPLVAYQSGSSASAAGSALEAPSSTLAGDLRITGDVRLFGAHGEAVTAAAGVEAYIPTGSPSAYTSDGTFRAIPRVLVAGELGPFVYSGRLGVQIRANETYAGSEHGSEMVLGAAAGVRPIPRLLIGPELYGATVLGSSEGAFRTRNTPLEALLGGHFAITPELRAGAGLGAGITRGYGSPNARGLLAFEWAPRPAAPPPPPLQEKPPPPTEIASAPIVVPPPPPPPSDPAPVVEAVAVLQGDRIRILDAVRFRFDSAALDPAGDFVLEAVLKVLEAHPELQRIRIEGHTDSVGQQQYNRTLSEARAASVRTWLIAHGIAAGRLESHGYGQAQPIMTNDTEDGRRTNRRVEFHVLSREEATNDSVP